MEVVYTVVSNIPAGEIAEDNKDTLELEPKTIPAKEDQTLYGDGIIKIKTNIKANKTIVPADLNIKINNKPCTDITITKNFTDNTNNPENNLELTCKAPQNPATKAGNKYDITITIEKYSISMKKKNAIIYAIPEPMQTFSYSQCQNMQIHDEKLMIDTRDNELYTMAKLKDNKCWMTQNLRYRLKFTESLTPIDSDVSENWTPNRATEYSISGLWNSDAASYKTVRSYYDSTSPDYGVYYTYDAATANSAKNIDSYGVNATDSVCPKGWRLPKDQPLSEFQSLYNLYGNNAAKLIDEYPKFTLAGYRHPGAEKVNYAGTNSFWWTSTVDNYSNSRNMDLYRTGVLPSNSNNRYYGFSVRCIKKEPKKLSEHVYLQGIEPETCGLSNIHETATLKDIRDNETYTVAKLKDGKCWMTQNLRLKLSTIKQLTHVDSDVVEAWTPPRSTEDQLLDLWNNDSDSYRTIRSYQDPTQPEHGTYYTHSAATAGSAMNIINEGEDATSSVCPKNWRLPKNNPSDFEELYQKYGNSGMINGEPKITLSGYRHPGAKQVSYRGSHSFWWTSTVVSSINSNNMDLYIGDGDTKHRNNRYYGFTLRCVAR